MADKNLLHDHVTFTQMKPHVYFVTDNKYGDVMILLQTMIMKVRTHINRYGVNTVGTGRLHCLLVRTE